MLGSMMRRAMLGDGSTLSLDFTAMSTTADLTARGLTFTRASTGTRINGSGYLETMSSNQARFDYDPVTNVSKGLLIEGTATNLVYHSSTFSLTQTASEPYWADGALMTRSAVTGPDNNSTSAINFVAVGSPQTVIQTAAVGSSASRTFSFWAKKSGGGTVEYTLDGGTTWTSVTITASWVRYVAAATTANQRVGFRIASGAGTELFGPMLEAGSGASSYIATGASQATRNADECSITGANFSSWFAGVTTGYSMLWSCSPQSRQTGAFPPMICIRGPSDSGSRSYYYNDGTYNTAHRTSNGTTASESFGPNSLTYGVARKFAISVTNGSQLVSSNGATANSNTQAITSFNQTIIGFGNDAGSPLGALTGRQHFQSFKFWPTALPQATLNSLTTL